MTGSTTKAFTAAAAALEVQNEEHYRRIQWTSPINEFLREDFVLENKYATKQVTIEDALAHTSGLPHHDLVDGQPGDTVADVTRRLRYLPLTAKPGQKYQYCAIMYAVICHLLQTVTGRGLADQLRDAFWTPLGMLSTTFTTPSNTSHLARGYYWYEPEERYIPENYDNSTSISGVGDIYSTVNDYALWIKALLEASSDSTGLHNKSLPLSHELVNDLFHPRVKQNDSTADGDPIFYAIGWDVTKYRGETLVDHGGGMTGFGSIIYMLPGKKFGVVIMANTLDSIKLAGASLAMALLSKKMNESANGHASDSLASGRREQESGTTQTPQREEFPKVVPPPILFADFTGSYSHPAYGTINVTLAQSLDSDSEVIETFFYPRTWSVKFHFHHSNSTTFAIRAFEPHGLGNARTGEAIVWDYYYENDRDKNRKAWAFFRLNLDGKTIKKLGMEIEPTLARWAKPLEELEWRKGMICF